MYPLNAQTHYSRQYTTNDGLPSRCINAIFKDSRGFLWIGTDAGLCLFDGKSFKIHNNSNGLLSNNVTSITEDDHANLWIGCMGGGICMFDGSHFQRFTKKEGLVSDDVRKVWYSKKFHLLFVGTNDGCSVLDGDHFFSYSAKEANAMFNKLFVCDFLEEKDWVNIFSALTNIHLRFYPKEKKFQLITDSPVDKYGSSMTPFPIKNGDTIFGFQRKGIVVKNGKYSRLFSGIGQVFSIAQDEFGSVWIAGWADRNDKKDFYGGLYRYDGKIVQPYSKRFGITDRSVWTIHYDSTFHILWVGTQNEGLFKIPAPAFTYYDASFFKHLSLSVNDLLFHNGSLWIAANGYMIRLEPSGLFQSYDLKQYTNINKEQFSDIFRRTHAFMLDPEGSYNKYQQLIQEGKYNYPNPYLQIIEDLDYKEIITAQSLYNPDKYQAMLKTEPSQRSSLSPTVFHLGLDSKGKLYFSDRFGLKRIETSKEHPSFTAIPTQTSVENFIFGDGDTLYHTGEAYKALYCSSVYPDLKYPSRCRYPIPNVIKMIAKGDELWLASKTQGLYRLAHGKVNSFIVTDTTLPKTINCMGLDQRGSVIVGTSSAEIFLIASEKDRATIIRKVTEKDGIVGSVIRWVITDRSNRLYAGTNLGLLVIDLNDAYRKGKIRVRFFGCDQGFTDCTGKFAALDQNGDIWVGAEHALIRINPKILDRFSCIDQRMTIKSLEVNNLPFSVSQRQGKESWQMGIPDQYQFGYDQTSLTFHFESLNYLSQDETVFRYRLNGLDSTWTNFASDPKAVFTSLPAGHYKLKVEYFNRIDNSRIGSSEYRFSIARPYYKTWWFITVLAFLVLSFAWLLYRSRIREIRKQEHQKAELQRELANTEMKALQAQMKPHFIFNAINSIQTYILDNDTDQALYYLSMFAKLIRTTLDNASKEFITLSEELEYLRSYIELEKMRFDGLFNYEEIIHPDIIKELILIPPMIIQPFIENAIKHGLMKRALGGRLLVEVQQIEGTGYKFIIEDNGVGRKYSESCKDSTLPTHQSKGMQIVSDRLGLLNAKHNTHLYRFEIIDLMDTHGNPIGTRIEVTFPIIPF